MKKPTLIHIDFETYSECDLLTKGAYAYSTHPTTRVLCMAWNVHGNDFVELWHPGKPCPWSTDEMQDIIFLAWNAQFERLIWNNVLTRPEYGYEFDVLPIDQFQCVAAQARTQACPGKLETAAQFLDRPFKKDMSGHRHMLSMCRPATEAQQNKAMKEALAKGVTLTDDQIKMCHHTPEALNRLYNYCIQDVRTEADIYDILEPWTDEALDDFYINEEINDRGIGVDWEFAKAAIAYADEEKEYFSEELSRITGGRVTTPRQFQRIKDWVLPRLSEKAITYLVHYKDGEKKYSLDAGARNNLLQAYASDPDFMDDVTHRFIEILDQAGKSTISKYETVVNKMTVAKNEVDPRVRGLYMFCGASQTGRYSSIGLQVHNLYRDVPSNAENLIDAFVDDDEDTIRDAGPPIHTLAKLIRPVITGASDGSTALAWCDWSSIEARMLPWLSRNPSASKVLDVFASGECLYCKTASEILGKTVTKKDKDERQAYGKVPVLSLGYGGGLGAFQAMAKNYGVNMCEDEIKDIVKSWRKNNHWAVNFWERLENAAMEAIRIPGMAFSAGHVTYRYDPDTFDGIGALWCTLPSGRRLCYPNAEIDIVTTSWGEERAGITAMKGAWSPKKETNEWPRVNLWSGLLAENITQAACADLLMYSLWNAENYGLTVVAHTHDEIIVESPVENLKRDADNLQKCMVDLPEWAHSFPIDAEVEYGYRYKVEQDIAA